METNHPLTAPEPPKAKEGRLACPSPTPELARARAVAALWRAPCEGLQGQVEALLAELARAHAAHHRERLEWAAAREETPRAALAGPPSSPAGGEVILAALRRELTEAARALRALEATCRTLEADRRAVIAGSAELRIQLRDLQASLARQSEETAGRLKAQREASFESGRRHERRAWVKFVSSLRGELREWLRREGLTAPSHLLDEQVWPPLEGSSPHLSTAFDSINDTVPDSTPNTFSTDTLAINARNAYEALIALLKEKLTFWREAARQSYVSSTKAYPQKVLVETRIEKGTSTDLIPEIRTAASPVSHTSEREAALLSEMEALKYNGRRLQEKLDRTTKKLFQRTRERDLLRLSMEKLLDEIQNSKREYDRPAALTSAPAPKKSAPSTARPAETASQASDFFFFSEEEEEEDLGIAKGDPTETRQGGRKAIEAASAAPARSLAGLLAASFGALRGLRRGRHRRRRAIARLRAGLSGARGEAADLRAALAGLTARLVETRESLAAITRENVVCLETLREAAQERERFRARRAREAESVVVLEAELRVERENARLLYTTLEEWAGYAAQALLTNIGLTNQLQWRKLLSRADRVEQCAVRQWLQERSNALGEHGFPSRRGRPAGSWCVYFKRVGIAVLALVRLKNLSRASYSHKEGSESEDEGGEEADFGAPFLSFVPSVLNSAWKQPGERSYASINKGGMAFAAPADSPRERSWVTFIEEAENPPDDRKRPPRAPYWGLSESRTCAPEGGGVEWVPLYPLLLSFAGSAAGPPRRGGQFPFLRARRRALEVVKLPPPSEFIDSIRRLFRRPGIREGKLAKIVPNPAHARMKLPSSASNDLLRGIVSDNGEAENSSEKLTGVRRTSQDAGIPRISPSRIIHYVLQSLSVARERIHLRKSFPLKSQNGTLPGDPLAHFAFDFNRIPKAPPDAAHIFAYNGFIGNRGDVWASPLTILEGIFDHLRSEHTALTTRLREREKDIEVVRNKSERLEEALTNQRIAFEAEKQEAAKRRQEASDESLSFLHASEAKYDQLRERLNETQFNWQKELEERRRAEEKVSHYQQQQFAHMATIHQMRNEIRSLNMELSFFTGHSNREKRFPDLNRELLMLNPNKVNASYEPHPTLSEITTAVTRDDYQRKKHVDYPNAQDFPGASPFTNLKEIPARERSRTPPADPKPQSLGQQYSTPDNRVHVERRIQIGRAENPCQGVDFSAECPLSSIPYRLSATSSSLEFSPNHPNNGMPKNTPIANNDLAQDDPSMVSPLARSATLDPYPNLRRSAAYVHQLLQIPSKNFNGQHPAVSSSNANDAARGINHMGARDFNLLGGKSTAAHPSISLELYVPETIRRLHQGLDIQVDGKK